ncbi:hypothetical protein F4780DRAFT_272195 [Xylariomycetidae sp. FL0641]|nr:hypothetical protein F4780DRAFT_272195 [Xylariomycetidae sp. FL0641]
MGSPSSKSLHPSVDASCCSQVSHIHSSVPDSAGPIRAAQHETIPLDYTSRSLTRRSGLSPTYKALYPHIGSVKGVSGCMDARSVTSTSTSTMERPSPRTRQKFKDSCTHCARAKVKCSREKPKCSRCCQRDLECSYGLSHRYGRLPAHLKLRRTAEAEAGVIETEPSPLGPFQLYDYAPEGGSSVSSVLGMNDFPPNWPTEPYFDASCGSDNSRTLVGCLDFDDRGYTSKDLPPVTSEEHFLFLSPQESPGVPITPSTFPPTLPNNPTYARAELFSSPSTTPYLNAVLTTIHRGSESTTPSKLSCNTPNYDCPTTASHQTPSTTAWSSPPATPVYGYTSRSVSPKAAADSDHTCLATASSILMEIRNSPQGIRLTTPEALARITQLIDCGCFTEDDHVRIFLILIGFEVMTEYSHKIKGTLSESSAQSAGSVLENLQAVLKLIERLLRRLHVDEHSCAVGKTSSSRRQDKPTAKLSTAVFGHLETELRRHLHGVSCTAMDIVRKV